MFDNVTLFRNFFSYVCHFICNTACCCFLYKYYHGKQMENSASDCCTVRTQTQCLCDMAAWLRWCCITLQIILLCLTVLSIGCKVHRHKVSMITVIFKKNCVYFRWHWTRRVRMDQHGLERGVSIPTYKTDISYCRPNVINVFLVPIYVYYVWFVVVCRC